MQSKLKKILLIFSITSFLVFCALFLFLFEEIGNNNKVSKQAQSDFLQEASRRQNIKDFNNSFKSIEEDKVLLETHFAQSSNIVPFLDLIEKTGDSVGTKAEVSFIEIAKDNSGLVIIMKDTGNFNQVYKFIRLLENFPYELELTSVEMHSVPTENKNIWEAILKIKLISFI